MSEKWLRCSIFKGMFSNEVAIRCKKTIGSFSTFVPRDVVRGDVDQDGTVKVMVFRKNDTAWAVLPSPDKATIPICESQLT